MYYHAPNPHWHTLSLGICRMCQYPVLDSTSDWSCCMWNLLQPIKSTTQGRDTLFSNSMSVLVPQTSFCRETRLPVHVHISGLLIFCTFADPHNSGKSLKCHKIHKNLQNTVKLGRNLIKYVSVLHFLNLSQLLGLNNLLAVSLQIYLETSSLKCANNVPKLPGIMLQKTGH